MRFSVRTTSVVLAAASLISISCEKHHVGEMPEVQKEHVDLAAGQRRFVGDAFIPDALWSSRLRPNFFRKRNLINERLSYGQI